MKWIASSTALTLAIVYLYFANPFNWFVPKSSDFDVESFYAVAAGQSIEYLTHKLGEPTEVRDYVGLDGCAGCKVYVFEGPPPDWLFSFREAWVITDKNGVVIRRVVNTEP
jgi:hypothetical protein